MKSYHVSYTTTFIIYSVLSIYFASFPVNIIALCINSDKTKIQNPYLLCSGPKRKRRGKQTNRIGTNSCLIHNRFRFYYCRSFPKISRSRTNVVFNSGRISNVLLSPFSSLCGKLRQPNRRPALLAVIKNLSTFVLRIYQLFYANEDNNE